MEKNKSLTTVSPPAVGGPVAWQTRKDSRRLQAISDAMYGAISFMLLYGVFVMNPVFLILSFIPFEILILLRASSQANLIIADEIALLEDLLEEKKALSANSENALIGSHDGLSEKIQ